MDIQDKIGRDEYERMRQYFSDMAGGDPQKLEILLNTKLMKFLKGESRHSYKHTFGSGKRAGETHTFVYKNRVKRDDRTSRILLPREIEKLFDAGIINEEEKKDLLAMLASPDSENLAMLEGIINQKRKERLAKQARDRRKTMKTIQENLNQAIEKFVEGITKIVLEKFNEDPSDDAQLPPGFFTFSESDNDENPWNLHVLSDLSSFFENEFGKRLASTMMKHFVEKTKALATLFVTEGYMVVKSKEEYEKEGMTIRPSQDPTRIEAVILQIEKPGFTRLIYYPIEPGRILGKRVDSEWLPKENQEGRFVGLLEKNHSAFATKLADMLNKSKN